MSDFNPSKSTWIPIYTPDNFKNLFLFCTSGKVFLKICPYI